MVIGKVKMIKIGFNTNRNKAKTTATIMADEGDATCIPGKKYAKITTANAVNNIFKITFIVLVFIMSDAC